MARNTRTENSLGASLPLFERRKELSVKTHMIDTIDSRCKQFFFFFLCFKSLTRTWKITSEMVNAASIKSWNPRYFGVAASQFNWECTSSSTYPRFSAILGAFAALVVYSNWCETTNSRATELISGYSNKIPRVLGRDWTTLNPKTTLRAANDLVFFFFFFFFKVQLQHYLPLIIPMIIPLQAPQVDLMYFFLDVVYIFRCDPQRNNN